MSASTLTVADGASGSLTFTDASDSYGIFLAQTDFCGVRTYEVQMVSDNSVVSWVSVTLNSGTGLYEITAAPASTTTEL